MLSTNCSSDVRTFSGAQLVVIDDRDARLGQRRQEMPAKHAIPVAQQRVRLPRQLLGRGRGHPCAAANHDELVEIAPEDAQELDAFEQWIALVACLFEHAALEFDEAHVAIDVI
jgi:hypothetical protein